VEAIEESERLEQDVCTYLSYCQVGMPWCREAAVHTEQLNSFSRSIPPLLFPPSAAAAIFTTCTLGLRCVHLTLISTLASLSTSPPRTDYSRYLSWLVTQCRQPAYVNSLTHVLSALT
jgi:hypothetical protein